MAVIKSTASRPTFAGTSLHDLGDLRRSAEETLAKARAEAERLVAEAKREVERIFSESRESGFEQGKVEGYEAGVAEGRAAGEVAGREEARTTHEVMIKALEESFGAEFMRWTAVRDELMRSTERELAGIAIAIAESIVREHVRAEPKAVLRQVEQAVSLFARATRVSIEVAPEDEALVRESLPSLCAALPPEADVSVRSRAGIARGGCYIRSSEGSVDARIETLFRRMREGIIGGAEPVAEPPAAGLVADGPAAAPSVEAPVPETATGDSTPAAAGEDSAGADDGAEPPAAADGGGEP